MKLRYKFVVRNVSGKPVAVAVGQDNEKFNGMIKLNCSRAHFLWMRSCPVLRSSLAFRKKRQGLLWRPLSTS